MNPFEYPETPHIRRHGPRGYADAESYRPWLRDEFAFRCVFCLVREQWENRFARFAIDHLRPESRYPHLATAYENLVYVCTSCNALKGDQDVSDPTQVLLSSTVRVMDDGELIGFTQNASELIELLNLNFPALRHRRRLFIASLRVIQKHEPELFEQLLSFPDDLPDLSRLRPPDGNDRPDGLAESYLVRRQRGELPPTY